MRQLEELARSTIESPALAPPAVEELRLRHDHRRRRRARRVTGALLGIAVLAASAVTLVATRDERDPRPQVATRPAPPTTTAREIVPGVPRPEPPRDQRRVAGSGPTAPPAVAQAPLAVGDGTAWVADASGVAAVDVETMERLGAVPLVLPVVAIATSTDGVWVLSGSNRETSGGERPDDLDPYHLTRIDPASRAVALDVDLPFPSSRRGHRNVRLAASPGVGWVTFGETLLRIDPATGSLSATDLPGHAAHIAADGRGVWIVLQGDNDPGRPPLELVRIDRDADALESVALPGGWAWSVASTGDHVWVVEAYADEEDGGDPRLHLLRIDALTLELEGFAAPVIAVVAGDGDVWAQVVAEDGMATGLLGEVDPVTGKIVRTVAVDVGSVPTSFGYVSPPFAVTDGSIWSASDGLEHTTP